MFSSQNSQVSEAFNYIEDVFSTYLYTGNGSTQTITNNIDLAGKGGLVWQKERDSTGNNHALMDTLNGGGNFLQSNDTNALATGYIGSFTSSGFTTGTFSGNINNSAKSEVSWTFREQPKFFDVVTYTGTGTPRTVAHNLGSVPGCIIVKRTSGTEAGGAAGYWFVYHRSLTTPESGCVFLNTTDERNATSAWNNTAPTSTNFTVNNNYVNYSGDTYVAYLFAHNAGGFGLTGTDNVISCGSFTTDGTGAAGNITLGYESQWVLIKRSDGVGGWNIIDTMRGSSLTSYNYLSPNTSGVESSSTSAGQGIFPTATGFYVGNNFPGANQTYVYIAIRRGPMKVPTTGTSVFSPIARTGTGSAASITGIGFPPDWALCQTRDITAGNQVQDKLRGPTRGLRTQDTTAETSSATDALLTFGQDGINVGANTTSSYWNYSAIAYVYYYMRRAPGFFDEVCYTGTGGSPGTQNHNLGVIPEFILTKKRSAAEDWYPLFQNGSVTNWAQFFALTSAAGVSAGNLSSYVSSSTFSGNVFSSNNSGATYVAYLFATCPGVSKVGSYTGTGALQTVACGFTSGARFVLVKRVDSTGDWYVWDSARGITSGNDPYLLINSTAAEVTSTNYVDTDTTGFKVTAAAPAALNASGGTYIFLAIA